MGGAREISTIAGDNAVYIRDTPPGELFNDKEFTDLLKSILGKEKYEMVCNGCDISGNRIAGGGCGFGENLQSLADFISGQFMKRAVGTSRNIVVLVPNWVIQDKVFAVTELEQIFQNENFKTINGISKENLKVIYNLGDAGKNAVYSILQETSQRAIGDIGGVGEQAKSLYQAIGKNGILNGDSSPYTISACYDSNNKLIGIQLDERGKGTIIAPPEETAYKTTFTNTTLELDESKLAELFGEERYKNYSDSEKQQAADLSDKLEKFINSTDSQDGVTNDTTSKGNTTGDNDSKQNVSANNDTTSDTNTKHTNTSDTDNGKTTSGESSDKANGTTESPGGEDSTTKGSNKNESGIKEDSTTSRTGTGDTNIKEDDETKRNTASDSDIKDDGTIKHSGTESSTTSRREFTVDTETEVAKKYMEASGKTADDLKQFASE